MSKQERRKRDWVPMMFLVLILIIPVTISIGFYRYLNPLSTENWTRAVDSNLTVQGIITKIVIEP